MRATILSVEEGVDNTLRVRFTPDKPLDYTAGQFIELSVPHKNVDSRGENRWFTLSSAPDEPSLDITTKLVESCSSYKKALINLKAGDTVEISQAMGDFVLPRQNTIPVLFIAAGIGITPVRSIIKSQEHTDSKRNISILYITNSLEPIFQEELETYTSSITYIPSGNNTIMRCVELAQIQAKILPNLHVYVSGPERFVEAVYPELSKVIKPSRIVTDYFHGYSAL